MTKTKPYLFHELSSVFPLIEGDEFNGLVEDIKLHGQLEEGVLFEGKILDGRNRYRACKILGIPFKAKEFSNNITPMEYIVSTNLHRRHLTIAQRAEIGLILEAEESKRAEERFKKIKEEEAKVRTIEGIKGFQKINNESQVEDLRQKIGEIKDELGEGRSIINAAKKVKIGSATLQKAKKIKEVAKEDKSIAKQWEEAKQGKIGVDRVYKEVQKKEAIQKLPEQLKKEVENKGLTIKEAKTVAESFKEPEELKEAVKVIKNEKKQHEMTMDYINKVGTGEAKRPTKEYRGADEIVIKKFQETSKQMIVHMTMRNINSYNNEKTREILTKIMKKCFEHLQKELQMKEMLHV